MLKKTTQLKAFLLHANIAVLLLAFAFATSSCSIEDDNTYEDIVVSFATIENPEKKNNYYLRLDDNTRLYAKEIGFELTPGAPDPADSARVLAEYVILEPKSQNNIKVRSLVYLSEDSIRAEMTEDEVARMEKEPFYAHMIYGGGGDLLNVLINCNTSSYGDYVHQIQLIKLAYTATEARFALVYTDGGDPGEESTVLPNCIDLLPLKELYPDSVRLVLDTYEKGNDGDPTTYSFSYKWQK